MWPACLSAAALLLSVVGCLPFDGGDDHGFTPVRILSDGLITDPSGLARSSWDDEIWFTHNVGDPEPRLFAVGENGNTIGVLRLRAADVNAWEAISAGPAHTLWVGDVGDEAEVRPSITVYRIREPEGVTTASVTPAAYRFTYPDGPHDAEAIAVHPKSGDLFIVTSGPDDAAIYRAPRVITAAGLNQLVRVSSAPPGVVAASFSPDGRRLAMVTRTQGFLYTHVGGTATPLPIPELGEVQTAEIDARGAQLLVAVESADNAVYAVPLPPPSGLRGQPAPRNHTVTVDCLVSPRGIPARGAYLGGALGLNDDPATWEARIGASLGLRRTYYPHTGVSRALETAATDLAAGRVPWLSFKLPHSWEDMARGAGDDWAIRLAHGLADLDGPVWVAFHHEPETDGDIRAWTAVQEQLAPLVRNRAPNVAYTVILTGWHQFFGEPQYRLDSLWPQTDIDVLAIDVYNQNGVAGRKSTVQQRRHLRRDYFHPVQAFASAQGAAWAVAETGLTDAASAADPTWLERTYYALVDEGGVALSYFNSTANAAADWRLSTPEEFRSFASVARVAPTLRSLRAEERAWDSVEKSSLSSCHRPW